MGKSETGFFCKLALQHSIVWIRFPTVVRLGLLPIGFRESLTFVLISDCFEFSTVVCLVIISDSCCSANMQTTGPEVPALGWRVYRSLIRLTVFHLVSITLLDRSYVKWAEETYIICIYHTTTCQTINTPKSAGIHQVRNKRRIFLLSYISYILFTNMLPHKIQSISTLPFGFILSRCSTLTILQHVIFVDWHNFLKGKYWACQVLGWKEPEPVGQPQHWFVHHRAAAGETHGAQLLRLLTSTFTNEVCNCTVDDYISMSWADIHRLHYKVSVILDFLNIIIYI